MMKDDVREITITLSKKQLPTIVFVVFHNKKKIFTKDFVEFPLMSTRNKRDSNTTMLRLTKLYMFFYFFCGINA